MGRLTPQDIREYDFKQSALGYNRDQVNELLGEIAEELETLIRESNTLHVENKEARLTLQTYLNVEDSLKETLLLAQKTGQDTIRSANGEARAILEKAEAEKSALLFRAKESLSDVQNDILKLQAKRDAMLIKLKNTLQTNLDVLESEFSDQGGIDLLGQVSGLDHERIVDFSQTDLTVEDMPAEESIEDIEENDAEATVDFREV